MTQFFGEPVVEPVLDDAGRQMTRSGRKVWRLIDEFRAVDEVRGEIVVPHGYVTDFASIPWIFMWIISPRGKVDKPSLLHDYVLARGVTLNTVSQQRWATGIFNRALKTCDVHFFRRMAMVSFVAVWTFGRLYL